MLRAGLLGEDRIAGVAYVGSLFLSWKVIDAEFCRGSGSGGRGYCSDGLCSLSIHGDFTCQNVGLWNGRLTVMRPFIGGKFAEEDGGR